MAQLPPVLFGELPNNFMNTEKENENAALLPRVIKFITISALVAWCAYVSVVHGNVGAGRVLATLLWFLAVCYILLACNKEACAVVRSKGRGAPRWLCLGYDVAMTGFLVWNGWWATAIASGIILVATEVIYTKEEGE